MKILKRTMAIFAAVLVSGAAFAQTSGLDLIGLSQRGEIGLPYGSLRAATAGAINDDATYFFDAYDWNKLSYGKFYGFTAINSDNSVNVAYSTKIKGDSLNVAMRGDFWGDAAPETLMVLYGHNNMSFAGSLIVDDTSDKFSAMPTLRFGMNYSPKIGFGGGFSYLNFQLTANSKLSIPVFTADGIYRIKDSASESLNTKLLLSFTPASYVTTIGSTTLTTKYNLFEIMPALDWQKKLSSTFSFGLKAEAPVVFFGIKDEDSGTSTSSFIVAPAVQAGFSAVVKPNLLLLNAGIATELPSLTFQKDTEVQKGLFSNSFFGGFTFLATSNLSINFASQFILSDGMSLYEIINQNFAISVSAKF